MTQEWWFVQGRRCRAVVMRLNLDLNLGCPQEAARSGHYGSYLLGKRDWPLVESIVSSMASSLSVPISTKIRLCNPVTKTRELAERLEASGASWIALHPRTVSATRRRQGAADLNIVRELKSYLNIPVVSNGNVRSFSDLQVNLDYTGADGLMVGEALLDNPCLFADSIPDPVTISLEYLKLCAEYPGTATMSTIQTHIRHFVETQSERKTWFPAFRAALFATEDIGDIENLLRDKAAVDQGATDIVSKREFNVLAEEEAGIALLH